LLCALSIGGASISAGLLLIIWIGLECFGRYFRPLFQIIILTLFSLMFFPLGSSSSAYIPELQILRVFLLEWRFLICTSIILHCGVKFSELRRITSSFKYELRQLFYKRYIQYIFPTKVVKAKDELIVFNIKIRQHNITNDYGSGYHAGVRPVIESSFEIEGYKITLRSDFAIQGPVSRK